MGREIRKVPPNWVHPRDSGFYLPLHEKTYKTACEEWIKEFHEFEKDKPEGYDYYWEYESPPPDIDDGWIPYEETEATWFQVYETVSEGTPLTPPFETEEELIDYLVNVGADHDGKVSRAAAERFVLHDKYAPSMTFNNGIITTGIESCIS